MRGVAVGRAQSWSLRSAAVSRLRADGELPPEIKAKPQPSRVEVEGKRDLRGFAHCDDAIFAIEEVPGSRFYAAPQNLPSKINGEAINEELPSWSRGSNLVFERDELVTLSHRYLIGNIFGELR